MWNPTETFADFAPVKHYYPIFHSPDAGTACCVCGGGEKSTYYPRHAALQAAASTASSQAASYVIVGLATIVGVVAVAKRMRDQSRHSEWREVGQPGETEPIMQARLPKLTYQ